MRNVRRVQDMGALPEIVVIRKPNWTEEVIPPGAVGNPGAGLRLYIAR